MFRTQFFVLTIAVLAQSLHASNFFPLEPGNSWTYRERASGQSFTVRVGTPVLINNTVYWSLSGYTDQRILVRQDGENILVLDEENGQEAILTSFEPFEGGHWNAHARPCDAMGQTQVKRGQHDGPAGPIPGVLEIRYRNSGCADAGVEEEQYAENLGMVRRTVQTIAGPRTFDLVAARAGHVRIETAPHGSFSVSYDASRKDTIAVGLKIETDPVLPVKLSFASGQEYDVALRDEADHVVYLWSSTALFIQSAHELTVAGEWRASVTIPRPAPGKYTLHAWMTTSDGASRYAATAPVIIAD